MIIDVFNVDSSTPLSVWLAYTGVSIWTKGSDCIPVLVGVKKFF